MSTQIAKDARVASTVLKTLSDQERSAALQAIHDGLKLQKTAILAANVRDMQAALESGVAQALVKRLDLSQGDKFDVMLQGVLDVAKLEDPVGKITLHTQLDDGLDLVRVTCPVGVLLIIFELRPEVIANITALAIKSGNAAILKGGKELLHTFTAMANVVNLVLAATAVPAHAIQLISSRSDVSLLLNEDQYIDLVVPRGLNELVRHIKDNTKIPVLGHADGICSVYVDEDADLEKAARIIVDAKTNYPAGCNAAEQLLVHQAVAAKALPVLGKALVDAGVTLHASAAAKPYLQGVAKVEDASADAFDKEYLSLDITVGVVEDVRAAMAHINLHSSKHTDVIVTENKATAETFLKGVDSAGVYHNCSLRFADGFRYGFGAEVGVLTNKIHARGPVGLEGLVCYQYQMRGNGQVAGDYEGAGGSRVFKHIKL